MLSRFFSRPVRARRGAAMQTSLLLPANARGRGLAFRRPRRANGWSEPQPVFFGIYLAIVALLVVVFVYLPRWSRKARRFRHEDTQSRLLAGARTHRQTRAFLRRQMLIMGIVHLLLAITPSSSPLRPISPNRVCIRQYRLGCSAVYFLFLAGWLIHFYRHFRRLNHEKSTDSFISFPATPRARSATSSSAASRRHPATACGSRRAGSRRPAAAQLRAQRAARRRFRHVNLLVPARIPQADSASSSWSPSTRRRCRARTRFAWPRCCSIAGMVAMREPVTEFRLEAPGGLVGQRALRKRQGERIEIPQRASFADALDADLEVEGLGTLRSIPPTAATASSSSTPPRSVFAIRPDEAARPGANRRAHHPRRQRAARLFAPRPIRTGRISRFASSRCRSLEENGVKVSRNAVAIDPGKLDRSPCGTGCSARMAVLQARGVDASRRPPDRPLDHRLAFRMQGWSSKPARSATGDAILPSIRGRAWITGTHQLMLDPDDPWPEGYRLTDTPGRSMLPRV